MAQHTVYIISQFLKNNMIGLSIVFMHFMIISLFGFPLTLAPFVLLCFITQYYFISKVKISALTVALFLVVLPGIVLIGYGGLDSEGVKEFFRTFALWLFSLVVVVVAWKTRIRKYVNFTQQYKVSLIIIVVFGFLQVFFAKFFQSTFLYFPFGIFSYNGRTDLTGIVDTGHMRANAFYLEPSFFGFILFFLITVLLFDERIKKRTKVMLLVAGTLFMGLIIQSSSGILALFGLCGFLLMLSVRTRVLRFFLTATLLCVTVVFVLFFFEYFIALFKEGSSGYWRLIAPTIILSTVLIDFPLGIPLGQMESFIRPFGLQHATRTGVSIDNGAYYLIFLFGWLGLLLFFFTLWKLISAVLRNDHLSTIYWWFVVASLQFSGGIFLPEYLLPLVLVTYGFRVALIRQEYLKKIGLVLRQ